MKKILVIYGPTATGKTALAIDLAKKYSGEIISADSRQVYKNLDIGTGKVSFDAQVEKHSGYWIVNGVKIYGFDLVNPQQEFSVADFIKFANKAIDQIIKSGHLPIVAGGTGFYIKALISGLDTIGIPANEKLRSRLEKLSASDLYQRLLRLDPKRAQSMNQSDAQNPRRLIRAIEVAMHKKYQVSRQRRGSLEVAGLKYQAHTKYKIPDTKYLLICLTAPNDYLYRRADKWLDMRMKHGLINEVQSLIEEGNSKEWLDNLGLEYRWITRFLLKLTTREQALLRLRGDIHAFIRRQKTFFRQFANFNIKIFDISKTNWQSQLDKTLKLEFELAK